MPKKAGKVKARKGGGKIRRERSSGGIVMRKLGEAIRVLLIKDGYGRWTWPKGNIERGETPEQAALREIAEETGVKDARILEHLDDITYFYSLRGARTFKTVHLYLCEARGAGLTIQTSEIEAGEWLIPDEALERVEYRDAKKTMKKAVLRYASIHDIPEDSIL